MLIVSWCDGQISVGSQGQVGRPRPRSGAPVLAVTTAKVRPGTRHGQNWGAWTGTLAAPSPVRQTASFDRPTQDKHPLSQTTSAVFKRRLPRAGSNYALAPPQLCTAGDLPAETAGPCRSGTTLTETDDRPAEGRPHAQRQRQLYVVQRGHGRRHAVQRHDQRLQRIRLHGVGQLRGCQPGADADGRQPLRPAGAVPRPGGHGRGDRNSFLFNT